MPRSLKELASEAITIQDASNGIGLSRGYHEALKDLSTALKEANLPSGTDDVVRHAISKLWASKLNDLAGMGSGDFDRWTIAYNECKRLAE